MEAMSEGHCGLSRESLLSMAEKLLEIPGNIIRQALELEYSVVLIPLVMQRYPMLKRNLVYTAVTRGKQLVVLIGQKKALAVAVKGYHTEQRWTKLADWLRQGGHS
jgi:hypothetical protein